MKNIIYLTLFSALLSGSVIAASHSPGFVLVSPGVYLYGTMNVTFNPDKLIGPAGDYAYMRADFSLGDYKYVEFRGSDENGNEFSCSVGPSNPLLEHALDVAQNLNNGSLLYVRSAPVTEGGFPQCNYVYVNKASNYLD